MNIGDRIKALKGGSSELAKTDNHAKSFGDKVELRQRVLDHIGAVNAAVLDCFAGAGKMHKAVWREAASYVGIDQRFFFDQRTAYVADNRAVLRSIDLDAFNVFDLDAYGSPWEQAQIIAGRRIVRKGAPIAIILTDGGGMRMKFGGVPKQMAELAAVPVNMPEAIRHQDHLVEQAIAGLARTMRCRVVKRWQAKRPAGVSMRYNAIVLERAG